MYKSQSWDTYDEITDRHDAISNPSPIVYVFLYYFHEFIFGATNAFFSDFNNVFKSIAIIRIDKFRSSFRHFSFKQFPNREIYETLFAAAAFMACF